jgi:hypothetical protein
MIRALRVEGEGQNWGWTRDTVWVDHGCRAEWER